jgi:hypothetical protein
MSGMLCIAYHGILETAVKHTHKFMQGITIRKQTNRYQQKEHLYSTMRT